MSWFGLLLTAGGFVAYFVIAIRFAIFQTVPLATGTSCPAFTRTTQCPRPDSNGRPPD